MALSFGFPYIRDEEIELVSPISNGAQGSVWKGRCRSYNVAVKIPRYQELTIDEHEALCQEVQIMSSLVHPNVCLFMGACIQPGNIKIVSELMVGSLTDLLTQFDEPLSVRIGWALEAAKGINWLHKREPPLIHMDLKPDNVLFDEEFRIKVCDFGLSLYSTTEIHCHMGTPLYMAPEVLLANQNIDTFIDEEVDVYSFGIMLWQITTKQVPFAAHSDLPYEEFSDLILSGERPGRPEGCSDELFELMESCWEPFPEDRPEFCNIIESLEVIISQTSVCERESIVDSLIEDPQGKLFWNQYCKGQISVTFDHFASSLCQFLSCNENPEGTLIQCLRFVLGSQSVTAECFGFLCGWYGPLHKEENPCGLLERVSATFKLPYFHGLLTGEQAQATLKNSPCGTYLVRLTKRKKNSYCISKIEKQGQISHVIIYYDAQNGTWNFHSEKYSTLPSLITSKKLQKVLRTTQFIRCTQYDWLFKPLSGTHCAYVDLSSSEEVLFLENST